MTLALQLTALNLPPQADTTSSSVSEQCETKLNENACIKLNMNEQKLENNC